MLINYPVCHVLEGQNREDTRKEKESGVQQRKQSEENGDGGEKRKESPLERGNERVKEQGQGGDLLRDPQKT